jgi:hypothetical protein
MPSPFTHFVLATKIVANTCYCLPQPTGCEDELGNVSKRLPVKLQICEHSFRLLEKAGKTPSAIDPLRLTTSVSGMNTNITNSEVANILDFQFPDDTL